MTQVTVTVQQAQVVVGEEEAELLLSPLSPSSLEIWQPGMAPGGTTGDLLVKSSDQDYDSEWTDQPIVDKLRFDLSAGETVTNGELAWNVDEGTLELGKGGVSNYIGQETMVLCRNASNTTTIPKGTALMFAGSLGASGRIKVAPMVANGTMPGYVFFGVADQAIAPASDGYVTVFGKIRGINTSMYQDGDILWCNPAVPGGFTTVEPQAPNLKLAVAAVLSAGNNGVLFVRWTTGSRLQDLHDVEANGGKADGDVLTWNSVNARWQATAPTGGGIPSGATVNDILVYGSGGTEWSSTPTVDSLQINTLASGITISPGQLRWNSEEGTLDLGQERGVVNQIGQEITVVCHNMTANTIGNGKAVMFTGTDVITGHPTIDVMNADGTLPGYLFLGVTTEEIAVGAEGYVTTFGKVRDIDTSAFPPDSLLWLDPQNPGEFTLTEPLAPALRIAAAAVIYSDVASGVIIVRADPGQRLIDCHDVEVGAAADGDYLGWNDSGQYWAPLALQNVAPKSITISEPLTGDSFTLFRTSKSTTLAGVTSLVAGTSPSVTYELRYAADRTASGTLAIIPSITENTTTGSGATIQNMPIPSGNYVWLNITAASGNPTEFNLSVAF